MSKEIPKLLLDIARRRVACGVKWLDKRAATDMRFRGWRLEMISLIKGRVFSHVHMAYNTDNPLALALKWESELASRDGRVTWATVAAEFDFVGKTGALKAQYLGFFEGNGHTSSWLSVSDCMLYCAALDQAWMEALGEHLTHTAPFVYRIEPLRPLSRRVGLLRRIGRGIGELLFPTWAY